MQGINVSPGFFRNQPQGIVYPTQEWSAQLFAKELFYWYAAIRNIGLIWNVKDRRLRCRNTRHELVLAGEWRQRDLRHENELPAEQGLSAR